MQVSIKYSFVRLAINFLDFTQFPLPSLFMDTVGNLYLGSCVYIKGDSNFERALGLTKTGQ